MESGFIDLHHIPGLITGLVPKKDSCTRNFFLKQNPSEANLTISDIKEMLQSESNDSLMSKLVHYAKNVSETNGYWNRAKDDLNAIITQI